MLGLSRDQKTTFALLGLSLLFSLPFLNAFEYFRHTEADRTLIGWEMLQSKDFVAPRLLGDYYLTKPPLFYAFLAFAFKIFGAPYEWAARLVSALAYAFLVGANFQILRLAKIDFKLCLLSSLMIATSVTVFIGATVAEIDMLHTLFCSLTLNFIFLWFNSGNRFTFAMLAWICAALAALTKGPPIILLLIGALAIYPAFAYAWNKQNYFQSKFVLHTVIGLILLLGLCAVWGYLLLQQHSLADLEVLFRREIFNRFVHDSKAHLRSRGVFYYPGALLVGLLPWSLIPIIAAINRAKLKSLDADSRNLRLFSLCVLCSALFVFSLSSGKSHRYILPLYPSACQLCAILAWQLYGEIKYTRWLRLLLVLLLLWRIPYAFIYAKYRNQRYSVRHLASEINSLVPAGEKIYIIELTDRWLPYYLVRLGRDVLRLTPDRRQVISAGSNQSAWVYFLTHCDKEAWRFAQEDLQSELEQIGTFRNSKTKFCLTKTKPTYLAHLKIERLFPDDYSKGTPSLDNVP